MWPEFGERAELSSLRIHAKIRQNFNDTPDQHEINQAVIDTAEMLRSAGWEIPDDFMSKEHMIRVIKSLEWNSSPGYPWCLQKTTNRQFFGVEDGEPSAISIEAAWQIIQARLKDRDCDPIRLFIKPEPHARKKVQEGRFRIISSVSVIDQIIDQMIFGAFNQRLIDTHLYHPIKTGWTPLCGGWKQVPTSGMVCADKSAWDWSVKGWLIETELRIREALCRNISEEWKDLARWRYSKLFSDGCEFVTSGGLKCYQVGSGVMKSGCVNTISSNSIMQCILHVLVSNRLDIPLSGIWCMGDDTMQEDLGEFHEDYFSELSKFCKLKEVNRKSEFAGMLYVSGGLKPIYPHKHAFNLLHVDDDIRDDLARSYALLYHRSVDKRSVRQILSEITDELPSDEFFDVIMDGLC